MINVQVDEKEVQRILQKEVKEKVNASDFELVFWDSNELLRRTCLSWNTIQERFFHDPRFPKHKVGGKWLFPAEKTKAFLLEWLEEQ